jgi:hypothetical protein
MATKSTAKSNSTNAEVHIIEINTETIRLAIIGNTPLILNRINEKAKRELLLPAKKKNNAEKEASLKHNPLEEFRNSPEKLKGDDAPTLLAIKSTALKGAMMTAALDLPGTKKAQIGRLTFVNSEYLPVYGIPQIFSTITRNSDINRTPDVRTRCIVPKWAMVADITFIKPNLNEQGIANLVAAAGITIGVGDYRNEKGKGNYGQFRVATPDDSEFVEILKSGGRQKQIEAMESPVAYDEGTEELIAWFDTEVRRRGMKAA